MSEKKQFDEFLGGSQELPHDVHVMKLITSRASEIAAMTYSIENPQHSKLVFQKLPLHMRRRVMSHNAKRLPRRLREAHLSQMKKSGLPPKSKTPSRKYRRKPRNLLLEYNRRSKNERVWLETHIWHAKRFHMTQKWGYRIANFSNDKCFKASYSAIKNHCLIQDISYYSCIEITGPGTPLIEILKTHCDPTKLTFGAKAYISGNREGTLMFYKKNGYPHSPLGNVYFLYKYSCNNIKTIWIWVHPSFYNEFLTEIKSSFQSKPIESESENSTNSEIEDIFVVNNNSFKIRYLKNMLNRFRLSGPSTLNVITEALKVAKPDFLIRNGHQKVSDQIDNQESHNMRIPEEPKDEGNTNKLREQWHSNYYNNELTIDALKLQYDFWETLKTLASPSQLPPNVVLNFTVLDPRFHIPPKRMKTEKKSSSDISEIPPTLINSNPIWEKEIRDSVSKNKVSTAEIYKLRSSCLVPGMQNDNHFCEDAITKIPILLIQKSGIKTDLASGIDIIMPSNWAMPFWLSFVYRCARAGALRESSTMMFETLNFNSPDVYDPDTLSYQKESLLTKKNLIEKYFRYPSNRRINFTKFGISSPFYCEWGLLMNEWTGNNEFCILRHRNYLSQLQEVFNLQITKRRIPKNNLSSDLREELKMKNYLIRIRVTTMNSGRPQNFAIICMPSKEDLESLKCNKSWKGPVESLHKDPNEAIRRELRKQHLLSLKRLQRRRRRNKIEKTEKLTKVLTDTLKLTTKDSNRTNEKSSVKILSSQELVAEQAKKMSKLFLPDCTKVRNSCDKEVMGYVTLGGFAYTEGSGAGIGFVNGRALLELINKNTNIVLVRNTQSRQYRCARLQILND